MFLKDNKLFWGSSASHFCLEFLVENLIREEILGQLRKALILYVKFIYQSLVNNLHVIDSISLV